jgi:hypothetical protein
MLLVGGDALQAAPVANFQAELDRMDLGTPAFKANVPTNSYGEQTLEGELTDLRAALSDRGLSTAEAESIADRYHTARLALEIDGERVKAWEEARKDTNAFITLRPVITAPAGISGLPPEFADHWRASVARYAGGTNDARTAWRLLLGRPAADRRYKSTWAAYLLGRSWELENPAEAIRYYRQVREFAADGFADPIGLAVASIGWEARLCLRQKNYGDAFELYLNQLAAGDSSAYVSLRFTAADALGDGHARLDKLAANPRCRKVITAYLISRGYCLEPIGKDGVGTSALIALACRTGFLTNAAMSLHSTKAPGVLWLEAVESAGIRDVESAEQFALAAYQCGRMEMATRWIKRSKSTPLAQWLQAKLELRDGKLDTAAELLAGVSRQSSCESGGPNLAFCSPFIDSLNVCSQNRWNQQTPGQQILGELGALRLARGEYTESLDCLLRAGFWSDAAYVAERVLTIKELKAYVDLDWPLAGNSPDTAARSNSSPASEVASMRRDIRYLLGRRMMRCQRGPEALPYYPTDVQPDLDRYLECSRLGHDINLPAERRAAALWEAARLANSRGMEMLGTEVEPDWAVFGGNYTQVFSLMDRATNGWVVSATADELRRAREHSPDPDERFHYRRIAVALAWEAAKMMPDNSDETARVLCIAGTWIKYRDPKAADVFYKSLVRRCRKTAIGAAADKRRWFPSLDDNGNLLPAPDKPVVIAVHPPC